MPPDVIFHDRTLPVLQALPVALPAWAEQLQNVFGIEITLCPHCGGRLRVIADSTDPEVIDRTQKHDRCEGLPRAPPARMASD